MNSSVSRFGVDFVEVLVDSIFLPPQCTLPSRGSLSVWMSIGKQCTSTREFQNIQKKVEKNRQISVNETLFISTAGAGDFSHKVYLKLKMCMYVSNVHKTLGSERIALLQDEKFSSESWPEAITYLTTVEFAGLNGLQVQLQIRIHNPQRLFCHSIQQNIEQSFESQSEQEYSEHDVVKRAHSTATTATATTGTGTATSALSMQPLPPEKIRRFSVASSISTDSPTEASEAIPQPPPPPPVVAAGVAEAVVVPQQKTTTTTTITNTTVTAHSGLTISTRSPDSDPHHRQHHQQLSPAARQQELYKELKVCKRQLAQLSRIRSQEQEQRQQGKAAVEAHVNTALLQNAQLQSENTYLLSCLIQTKVWYYYTVYCATIVYCTVVYMCIAINYELTSI